MTKKMAQAFCAFNAFAFFAFAIASGLVLAGMIPPELTATGVACVSVLCGMVMCSSVCFLRNAPVRKPVAAAARKRKAPAKRKPAPALKLPEKMSDPALAGIVAKIDKATADRRRELN